MAKDDVTSHEARGAETGEREQRAESQASHSEERVVSVQLGQSPRKAQLKLQRDGLWGAIGSRV